MKAKKKAYQNRLQGNNHQQFDRLNSRDSANPNQ